ncbi:LysR family transcriptional regulator [Hydrogenophaga sp.]|uniref:LysR family transcriptional regulator n=1 Tax=Hydrogenophaga sp. TaxID=1904254 RepID=UPI00260D1A04|nr:LysR family transcriptional regulator [Hydrogenophaga sp.]MCW5652547.1 LysR family transcriptional regulator [Hydrogenophaga sp.]
MATKSDRHKPDDPLLDVKLLRFFDALYTLRRLGRVAEQLGQSPPTVSIWLSHLRTALQDPLFVRTATGMQPTPRADALIGTVREALAAIRSLSEEPPDFNPAQDARGFRLCMSDGGMLTLLPQLLAHMRVHAPQVRLEAIKISPQTAAQLESGEADLAVGLVPDLDKGFYQQALFDQVWVCLVNPEHPRLRNTLDRQAYMREGHVNIVYGTGHRMLDAALERAQVTRQVFLEMPVYMGIPAIVSSSDLIATMPSRTGHALARSSGLSLFPCPIPVPPFTVKQYWHERYHHDPGLRWLRSVVQSLFLERAARAESPPSV